MSCLEVKRRGGGGSFSDTGTVQGINGTEAYLCSALPTISSSPLEGVAS